MNPYQQHEPFYRNVTDEEMGYARKGYEWCRKCGAVEVKEPDELCVVCKQEQDEFYEDLNNDR